MIIGPLSGNRKSKNTGRNSFFCKGDPVRKEDPVRKGAKAKVALAALAVFLASHPVAIFAEEPAIMRVEEPSPGSPDPAFATVVNVANVPGAPANIAPGKETLTPPPPSIDAALLEETEDADDFWKPELSVGSNVSVVFDDNLFIDPVDEVSDTILVTSARLTVAFGNVLSWAARFINVTSRALLADAERGTDNLLAITYAPTAGFFFDNDTLNTVDHDLAATVRWNFPKLSFALDGRFQSLSDPDPELGTRVDRTLATGDLAIRYPFTEKTSLELDGKIATRDYDIGTDSTQWDARAFGLYQITEKTFLGAGFGLGWLDLQEGDSETFQQLLLRLRYNSFSKVTFIASGGIEFRQLTAGEDQTNGVFEIGLAWQPAINTEITLSAFQRTDPAASGQSQTIERTGIALGLNQLLFQKFTLGVNIDYTQADFSQNEQAPGDTRSDANFSISANLGFEVTEYGVVRLGYTWRQNDSSDDTISYESNQLSLSLTVVF